VRPASPSVDELAAVHGRDLPHEVDGMRMSLRVGHEELFVLRLVAAQRQQAVRPDGSVEWHVVRRRPGTVGISAAIQKKYDVEVVPHLICGGGTSR